MTKLQRTVLRQAVNMTLRPGYVLDRGLFDGRALRGLCRRGLVYLSIRTVEASSKGIDAVAAAGPIKIRILSFE